MKITKSQLRQIIKEELGQAITDRTVVWVNENLDTKGVDIIVRKLEEMSAKLNKLFDIDTSIDYLAAAITNEDPINIGIAQAALGRAYRPPQGKSAKPTKLKGD